MTIKTLSRTYHIIQFGLTLLKWVKYLLPFAIEIKMNVLYYTICIIRSYCWMNGFNFQIMLLLFIFNIFAEMCQSSMVIRVLDRNYINDLNFIFVFSITFFFWLYKYCMLWNLFTPSQQLLFKHREFLKECVKLQGHPSTQWKSASNFFSGWPLVHCANKCQHRCYYWCFSELWFWCD